jgi:methylmalonyl-CoA mutase N-terminal domain/subunit
MLFSEESEGIMFSDDYKNKIKEAEVRWNALHKNEIDEAKADPRVCEDGIPLDLLYTPTENQIDFLRDIGFPGDFPFTRGRDASGYRKNLWTISHYAGFGIVRDTNRLFRNMIKHGNVPPYLALDLPTQLGYDPDHPMARGEVGRTGIAIKSLKDWEIIFDGIELEETFAGTVTNAQAAIILAMHVALAEKQGANLKKLRGSLQNDILKEFTARGNYIFPVSPSLRLVTDIIEYCSSYLPAYWPINVCGGHFAEAGSNRIHEVAFAFADAFVYIEEVMKRGISMDQFGQGIFFLMKANHYDFFEEIAKFRAMRKIWASKLRDCYGARDPETMKLKILGHSGGSQMTRERPELNIARTAIACMAGAMSGIQLIGLRTMDEVFGIPTEKSELIAIGTQHVVAYETGLPDVVDPLGGSYYLENLTMEFEKRVLEELDRIEKMGGMVKAIESGYVKKTIAEDAYQSHKAVMSDKKVKVGVNRFRVDEKEPPRRPYKLDPQEEVRQIEELKELKRNRDNELVDRSLSNLKDMARRPPGSENNLVPPIIDAVKAYATMGEICGALREVFGEYKEASIF